MSDAETIFDLEPPLAFFTLNRPHARNAMTWGMYHALGAACDEVDRNDAIRVFVLRGAGGKAFVAGTDIRQFLDFESGDTGIEYERDIDRYVGSLESVSKPTVAVIEGYATGSGLAMSAACDLRVCTPDAKFGMPIARTLGNCLSMRGYARLVALLGEARTKDVIFNARMVDAEEARAAGLATALVEAGELEAHVDELVERLAGHAPITLRVTKEAIRRIREATVPDGDDLVAEAYGSEDFRKGAAAFLEKRPYEWTGR